ncbi:MAG: primosomal protein N' [Deltaproteobacteria bacterium]|jgi:primosomal protein N' (replication factor Y)|nr:primosomal protein N' [Deltaproteobacteria bacterium]
MMTEDLFAEVAIMGTALDKSLHYSVPDRLAGNLLPGSRVIVELGRRSAAGIVLSIGSAIPELPESITIRPIRDSIDELPAIPPDLLTLCLWLSRYYFYPLGEVFDLVIPFGVSEPITSVRRRGKGRASRRTDPEERQNLKAGVFELTGDQAAALQQTLPFVETPSFQPFVLYGVTGSGKTEVYMRLVEKAAESGNGAILLVPEIGISAQMESIFRERFGNRLCVWHSALSEGERKRSWADIRSGAKKIVLGARSAVLTPVQNLGLIIVDEEHDSSYKQEDHLRYNARDVALMRGKIVGGPVIMGSATPSIQTVHRCAEKRYRLISMPARILNRSLPELEVVDMKREGGRRGIFSFRLREAIGETMRSGQQALLFLNRRGYSKYYLCNTCGHALECESCSVTLTYHKGDDRLRCHFCGWETHLPERCPVCGHAALFPRGFGTEKVEKEVKKLFPEARLVRVDRDTMNTRRRLVSALGEVRSGEADILLGTQMVSKGHDFPNMTLVGVINADAGLQAPDFRAGETLVQLLIQVAGRAGRGEEPGRVILQTYNPDHFTIESALRLDYDGFCREELKSREKLQYPPFSRLLKLLVTSADEGATVAGARLLTAICREKAEDFRKAGGNVAVLGPSPAAFVKLKNRFRWQLFIKTWTSPDMQDFVQGVLDAVKGDPALRAVQITVDRDPSTEV